MNVLNIQYVRGSFKILNDSLKNQRPQRRIKGGIVDVANEIGDRNEIGHDRPPKSIRQKS